MANKIWDEPIDKYTNWGGDLSTLGLPVSGNRVQEFIKDSLNGKAGFFYRDAPNNRYLVFADRDNFEIWKDDPSREDLIMAAWEAPYNYTAQINLITPQDIIVSKDTLNNIISFTYTILNTNEQEVGDDVTCTYTFRNNDVEKSVSEKYIAGQTISFNADPYLKDGVNNIRIDLYGKTTYATTFITLSIRVINLELSDSFDISKPYTVGEDVQIRYFVTGSGARTVEWYLDGVAHSTDTVYDINPNGYNKTISTTNLLPGVHNIQFRAYTDVGGTLFYTDILYREFIIRDDSVHIATACTIPNSVGILANSANLQYYGAIQYVPYEIRYAVYNHDPVAITEVEIYVDNVLQSTVSTTNEVEYIYALLSKTSGQHIVKFVVGNLQRSVPANVELSSTGLQEYTDGLEFNFSAIGRSNSDRYKAPDEISGKTAHFNDFNWNITSGWLDNNLVISSGASLQLEYSPLATNPTISGKTLEFEFATSNVSNDDAIVCDLRGPNGIGLLITATQAAYYYRTNTVPIYTRFKPEETIRLSFVVTPRAGADEPRLIKLYINGVLSGAVPYTQYEDLSSQATLMFSGTNEVEILLKYVRIYNGALSNEQILNNYILYRENAHEMLTIFNRNDIKTDGSFDLNKMSAQLPVMIITGPVYQLEATSDKNETITVDIDYTNLQDPTRSFRAVNAAMRPQGTSSMSYPKKNFRIYINRKGYDTIFYDYNGDVVTDRTYSFKAGAQKVSTWCLKADYAESSSSHNTGVAKLWNKVMYDAVVTFGDTTNHEHDINEAHALRTIAQQTEYENNRKVGDVRTTVDGFPILLFYRPTYNDSLIFIGKYNFNNDKSTESVYGFVGIPNFDNSKVQCIEVKQNNHRYALFQTTAGFNDRREFADQSIIYNWQDAFEYRYPDDGAEADTTALKAFADWMVGVNGDHVRFASEKWDHFDVYKIAAYYVYLMRFGAVDQFVKNAMFTTEDGIHWFYINYDNDTIFGLRNDGMLVYDPTIDRNTSASGVQVMDDDDETSTWAYAGHDSNLWNMLEADTEFMNIVSAVDYALYTAGLTYEDAIEMFNTEQSDKWNETIFNEDAQYKYIGPWFNGGTNRLYMLQGKRDAHRKWWISHRFMLYDSVFVSGAYKKNYFEFKTQQADAGTEFSIKAGYNLGYGYGINTAVFASHVMPDENNRCTFNLAINAAIGDPVRIFAAPLIEEIDIHNFITNLSEVALDNVYDESLGTKLKKLVLGVDLDNDSRRNTSNVFSISGLEKASKLEWLDVRGYAGLTTLDVSKLTRLKTLLAYGTSLSSVSIAPGALIENLYLPQTLETLVLEDLAYLNYYGLHLEEYGKNIKTIIIRNCPNLTVTPDLLFNWGEHRITLDNEVSVTATNISWSNVDPDDLIAFGQFAYGQFEPGATRRLNLSGIIRLTSINQGQAQALVDIFGPDAFKIGNSLYIVAPKSVFLTAPIGDVVEGGTYQFTATVFDPDATVPGTIKYYISSSSPTTQTMNENTGFLTTVEIGTGYDRSIDIWAEYTPAFEQEGGAGSVRAYLNNFQIKAKTYPTAITITGNTIITDETRFEVTFPDNVTGTLSYEWSISGSITDYVEISQGATSKICYLRKTTDDDTIDSDGILTVTVRRTYYPSARLTTNININIAHEEVVMTVYTNPTIFNILYARGLTDNNPSILTKTQAQRITADDFKIQGSNQSIFYNDRYSITSFPEFKEFTGVTEIPDSCFMGCGNLANIEFPETLRTIGASAFQSCSKLISIELPSGLTSIGNGAFRYCNKLQKVSVRGSLSEFDFELPSNITSVPYYCFENTDLTEVLIGSNIQSIGYSAFRETKISSIVIPSTVLTLTGTAFAQCQNLTTAIIYSGTIGSQVFLQCHNLTTVTINCSAVIDYQAFFGCENLETVTLSNITGISTQAFAGCQSLESITLPSTVTSIGERAFKDSGIKTFEFGENIQTLSTSVFENCSLNTLIWNTVHFSNFESIRSCTIQTLYLNTFGAQVYSSSGTYDIKNLVVGENLTSMPAYGNYASSIATILQNTETISVNVNNPVYHDDHNCWMEGTILRFGCKNSVIPTGTTVISDYAFYRKTEITSVTILNTITTIKTSAFQDCSNLETVTFEPVSTLTTMETAAFYGTAITSISIPETLTAISVRCFANTNLTSVVVSNNITSIGYGAFSDCQYLTSLYIGSSVNSISTDTVSITSNSPVTSIQVHPNNTTFSDRDCNGVFTSTGVILGCSTTTIPSGITTVGVRAFSFVTLNNNLDLSNIITVNDYAFYGCTFSVNPNLSNISQISQYGFGRTDGLTDIYLSDGIRLSSYAFYNSSLQTLNIGSVNENVSYAAQNAFSGCNQLTTVTFRNTTSFIASSEFSSCNHLTTLVFPESSNVTTIKSNAFYNCTALESVALPINIVTIESSAFQGCSSLASITLPSTIVTINDYGFSRCRKLQTMTILSNSAPTIYTNTFQEAGADATGTKLVVVPTNATLYDVGYWSSIVQSGLGFQLSKTL